MLIDDVWSNIHFLKSLIDIIKDYTFDVKEFLKP